MIACRAGLISPTAFVQQINTASALIGGRVCVNMVCGHSPHELRYYGDHLSHDERYQRTDEFLSICRALWKGEGNVSFEGKFYRIDEGRINTPFVADERSAPEIFLGGNSAPAADLAARHADCLWRFPDAPERLGAEIEPLLRAGTEVGLLCSLVARSTRDEARQAACSMIESFGTEAKEVHRQFAVRSDSVGFTSTYQRAVGGESDWITPWLWTGAVPYLGAPAIALVGSAQELADVMVGYKRIGISQFLFMGWPDLEEMTFFGEQVLPLIRAREGEEQLAHSRGAGMALGA
jgi:alkanesulfonate monooxygenase